MGHLERFIQDARRRVAGGAYDRNGPALQPNGSFKAALQRPDAVIAELKPRSPSRGRLLHGPPEPVVAAFKEGGAAALSVLTDADHFDGSPDLLRAAHAAGLPLLMKDFVVTPEQVACGAHHGASAVLLIERCFADPTDREDLVRAAHAAGLEVLLEVHSRDEAAHAADSAADLVGVNARDLDTLDVDPAEALGVIADLAGRGRDVVALSGIAHRTDRMAAMEAGATAVLVGSHLMTQDDPGLALRALRRPLAKVCGITDEAGLQTAVDAGADLVGFVVGAPDSPRDLPPINAQRLVDAAREQGIRTVLVTPHEDAWEVREWCRLVRPHMVQLTRLRPDPEWLHSLAAIPVHPLHVVTPTGPLPAAGSLPATGGILVDTPSPQGGGSGCVHDWTATAALLHGAAGRLTLVAGGLDGENAADAVVASGAWGADASSGLEAAPGRKDPDKVRSFVAAVHGAHVEVAA